MKASLELLLSRGHCHAQNRGRRLDAAALPRGALDRGSRCLVFIDGGAAAWVGGLCWAWFGVSYSAADTGKPCTDCSVLAPAERADKGRCLLVRREAMSKVDKLRAEGPQRQESPAVPNLSSVSWRR